MCPNMNHFDAVDFSECHSEEVISFFDAQFTLQQVPIFFTPQTYLPFTNA